MKTKNLIQFLFPLTGEVLNVGCPRTALLCSLSLLFLTLVPFLPADVSGELILLSYESSEVAQPSQGGRVLIRKRTPNILVTCLLSCLGTPLPQSGQATRPAAQGAGVVSMSLGPPKML